MKIYYEQHSDLSKQDILFIHGNVASAVWWQPALREWKKAGGLGRGSLIFTDWRGCGHNPDWSGDKPFTIEDLANDYLELLRDLGKEEICVVGHSLGGLIALQMMILDPRRVSRALLLDAVGLEGVVFDDSMYEAFRQMAGNRELTRTVILATIRNQDHQPPELLEAITDDAFKAVKGIGTSVLGILRSVNLCDKAASIRVPTLLLHGQHDQVIPLEHSQKTTKILPNARLEILPEAGHCWNVENPAAFVKRVREWF